MSYCKFQNTLEALRQCESDMKAESREEKIARKKLLELCAELTEEYGENTDREDIDRQEDDE